MSESLRENLASALSDKVDQQIINGAEGLLNGTNLQNHNASAVTTYADYRDLLAYGRVDGKFASGVSDIRILLGAGTHGHAAKQFRSANAGDRAAIEDLMQVTGGVRVSDHIPAVDSSHKQNAIVRLGSRRDAVCAMWQGVSLIPDEITKAASGQIVITAVLLCATKILRAAGFYKQQVQVS